MPNQRKLSLVAVYPNFLSKQAYGAPQPIDDAAIHQLESPVAENL